MSADQLAKRAVHVPEGKLIVESDLEGISLPSGRIFL